MKLHHFPPKYSFDPVFQRFIKERIEPNKTVLDLASKDFRMARHFRGLTYVGGDIDISALRRGVEKNIGPNCHAVQCDLLRPPFADEAADYVICTHTLIHLSGNARKLDAIKELARMTKNGGSLFFNIPLDDGLEDEVDDFLQGSSIVATKTRYRRTLCALYEVHVARKAHRSANHLVRILAFGGALLAHLFDYFGRHSYAIYVCQISAVEAGGSV